MALKSTLFSFKKCFFRLMHRSDTSFWKLFKLAGQIEDLLQNFEYQGGLKI